ncbi:MAG: response regulator [Endozoicomonadaceae bacterium]|nr:response regulator [Endozoicomonadaceae bacterium]
MPTLRKTSIERKLRYAIMTTVEICLLIALLIYSVSDYFTSRDDMTEHVQDLVKVISSNSSTAVYTENATISKQLIESLYGIEPVKEAHIINKNGVSLAGYFRDGNNAQAAIPAFLHRTAFVDIQYDWVDVVAPIYYDQKVIGSVIIRADLAILKQQVILNILAALIITILTIIFSYLMAHRLQKVISGPIVLLADTMTKVASGQTHISTLEKQSDDEIGQLYERFNGMIEQIHKRDEQLSVHREELEKTVELRTTALNLANKSLKRAIKEATEAKEDALYSAKAKSAFLANMSHEIRTPMNGVLGMLDMMRSTNLDDNQLDYLETAYGSADALLSIINDILDFSKIEAGKLELEQIDINICVLVEDIATLLASKAREKFIELACYIDVKLPLSIKGDPVRLRQVLMNLLGNAVKFTSEGEVLIRTLLIGNDEKIARVRFEIHDTGIGIEPDVIPTLFTPFTQADGSTTRKFGGTGLGLTISRQLVDLMSSELQITSELGHGSCFFFEVDFEISKQQHTAITIENSELAGTYALIVDDNRTNRNILKYYLSAWGVDHAESERGEHTIQKIRDAVVDGRPFDIVYLDMNMPDIDGVTLSKAIEADSQIRSVRRIMLTSSGYMSEQKCRDAFLLGSLTKPYRQANLLKLTKQAMGLSKEECPIQRQLLANDSENTENTENIFGPNISLLLVEDNIVNQKVALAMLKKIGLTATVANNGKLGVEAWEKNYYDLILMDCQMPEMSGYEATGSIRQKEQDTHTHAHTVIIAMTANAIDGDREACLASGMDDYLSKPIKIDTLKSMLIKWLKSTNKKQHPPVENITIDEQDLLLNITTLEQLRIVMEDEFETLVDNYIEDSANLIQDLMESSRNMDINVFIRAGHTLKSSSQNMGADRLATLAKQLEELGHKKNITEARAVLKHLDTVFQLTCEALKKTLDD